MIECDSFDSDIYDIACDYCSWQEEIDSKGEWNILISKMKTKNWRISKVNNIWKHMCPLCAKEEKIF